MFWKHPASHPSGLSQGKQHEMFTSSDEGTLSASGESNEVLLTDRSH